MSGASTLREDDQRSPFGAVSIAELRRINATRPTAPLGVHDLHETVEPFTASRTPSFDEIIAGIRRPEQKEQFPTTVIGLDRP